MVEVDICTCIYTNVSEVGGVCVCRYRVNSTISKRLGNLNPSWNDNVSNEERDVSFYSFHLHIHVAKLPPHPLHLVQNYCMIFELAFMQF